MRYFLVNISPWLVCATLAFGATEVMVSSDLASVGSQADSCSVTPCPVPCPPKPTQVDCCKPEFIKTPCTPAYNASAVARNDCGWNTFLEATFIYWQPMLENLELGIVNTYNSGYVALSAANIPDLETPSVPPTGYGPVVNMEFDFQAGFQVAAGFLFDYDHWSTWAQYTYFHNQNSHSKKVGPNESIMLMQAAPGIISSSNVREFYRKWDLDMDLLDVLCGREYFVGQKLTFKTFFGLRAAWIDQELRDSFLGLGGAGGNGGYSSTLRFVTGVPGLGGGSRGGVTFNGFLNQNTNSWGIGPRLGVDIDWLLGYSIRFIGNGSADLLYTRYTEMKNTSQSNYVSLYDSTEPPLEGQQENIYYLRVKQKDLSTVRTHLQGGLGFGWGSHFSRDRCYIDLAATYTFQVFFSQNMFRQYFTTGTNGVSSLSNGDLYIQGFNLAARLDF